MILFLDGTWNDNDFNETDTNIVRLRNILAKSIFCASKCVSPSTISEVNQFDAGLIEIESLKFEGCDYIFFYERGVGTGPGLDRLSGGALGWGLDRNIRRAYKFLSRYYSSGSEIFIFGFSRGAYTARSLVGYLGAAGLLKSEYCDAKFEEKAWKHYLTSPNDRFPATRRYLESYTHPVSDVRISCLGLFDTVGTIGVPLTGFKRLNRDRYEFHDVELSPLVKLNLHALSIDENRIHFPASVWRGGKLRLCNSIVEQVWFPGVHSDVGGGYYTEKENKICSPRPLDNISLDWMLKRIHRYYPDFPQTNDVFPTLQSNPHLGVAHTSIGLSKLLYGTALRTIGNLRMSARRGETIVNFDRDTEVVGESIHISAIERLAKKAPINSINNSKPYLPRNLIENIINLHERYCTSNQIEWSLDTVSITSWSGDRAEHLSDKNEFENIRNEIINACERLKNDYGVDVLNPPCDTRHLPV